ncbi:MAG: prolyl oligopeptidase family serine peptidase [Bacteroidaceae bacterium]|nr:prolyl oligopeptidase family serine peptidase [Bacteroidaceae bacterium]
MKEKGFYVLAALFLLMVGRVMAAKVEKTVNITVNGVSRSYLLYVPDNVKENPALVLSLHGTGGNMNNKAPMRTAVADDEGFIVVYPQGSNIYFPVFGGTLPGWKSTGDEESDEDVAFFKAIIEDVAKTYSIDRQRIYCCGFSNGGMMTYSQSNTCADVFAAFASISGFPLNEFHLHHTGVRPVPFLHIHGKNDNFVDIARMPTIVDNMVARIGANPVPVVTTAKGKYTKSVYQATEGGFPYIYYVVEGMGHEDFTSNTEDGSSAVTMWKFMKQYTLDSPCDMTLKWRPNVEAEGWNAKEHGWSVTSRALMFGDNPNDKQKNVQNVYHSLQLAKGVYKLCFRSEGEEGTISVSIKKWTGNKAKVLDGTAKVGEDATMVFRVEDDWAECRFLLSSTSAVTITGLSLYTATEEEMTAVKAAPLSSAWKDGSKRSGIYNLAGVKMNADVARLPKGIYMANHEKFVVK